MSFPSHPFKICSQCQTPAEPDAPLCEQCGRVFSAQSSTAMYTNRQPVASDTPHSTSGKRALIAIGLVVVAILSYAGYRYQTEAPDHMEVSHPPAQYNAALGQHSAATPNHGAAPAQGLTPKHGSARGHAQTDMAPNPQFQHKGS